MPNFRKLEKLTFPAGLFALESNLIRAVPPCASTRLISSTRSGARRIIIANARGFLVTRLKVSSEAGGAASAVVAPELEARFRGPEPPAPPTDRRLAGADGRCGGGGGNEEWMPRLPPPRPPTAPPPRPSLAGPPYIGEE